MEGFFHLSAADLYVLGLTLLPPLVIGVPLLLKSLRQPEEIALEPVTEAELEDAQRRWLARNDERFAKAGFRPAGTWRITNLPHQRGLFRSYRSPADVARGSASALTHAQKSALIAQSWIEFTTVFADDSYVSTGSVRRSPFTRSLSRCPSYDAPGVDDPAKLRAIHERNCAPQMARGPRHDDPARFEESFRREWRRTSDWRCAQGLFRRREEGQTGLSLRGAVAGMLDTILPSAGAVGMRNLLVALVAGVGLPYFAYGPLLTLDVSPFAPLLGRPSALLAAAVMVPLLEGRALWWAPILTWFGPRLALGADAAPGGAFAWVAGTQVMVILASTLQNRLRARA